MGALKQLAIEAQELRNDLPRRVNPRWITILSYASLYAREHREDGESNKKSLAEIDFLCKTVINELVSSEDVLFEAVPPPPSQSPVLRPDQPEVGLTPLRETV